jgi:predicted deacetylase
MATIQQRRILLASIHDVSPRFESEVDALVERLERSVGNRIARLVVPNHWHESPILPGSSFAAKLRNWADRGIEMFLHGFFHRDEAQHEGSMNRLRARHMTAGEGEFLGLTLQEASRRISDGRALLEDVTGRPIDGFVAPAWLYGEGALEALHQSGIALAEDHWRVWSPRSGETLARGPVITWASRTRARLLSSLAAAAALRHLTIPVLRIGVHPPDVRSPALLRSIDASLKAGLKTRHPGRYSELLAS